MKDAIKARLMKRAEPIPFSGCIIWTGDADKNGYGWITIGGKKQYTHRVSHWVFKGQPNYFVCHTCDVPSCINPDHLYDGTNSQNMQDRSRRGRALMATGERHGKSRFTQSQIESMREMKAQGKTLREIADAFGTKSTGHICNIVNNKLWRS